MRVRDLHNVAGLVTGFEVSNTLLSRRRACRIAGSVTGATIRRWPRRWAWSDDDFCRFDVDGVSFLIIEPFGDNDCYWIVAENPAPVAAPLIDRVRQSFVAAWGWPLSHAG